MKDDWNRDMRNLLLAGLEAVSVTAEKSSELVEKLVKQGELTVAQGRALHEELRQGLYTTGQKAAQALSRKGCLTAQIVLDSLETMNQEERAVIRQRLEELAEKDVKKTNR